MTPQFKELLLEILHTDSSKPKLSQLSKLSQEDWQIFVDEAIDYRLAYQIQEHLKAKPERLTHVPETCINRLAENVRTTLIHNLGQQHHLHKILSACQAANLPIMLVKGLWLTKIVYEDVKARNSGDIDLVLHPQDMLQFIGIARDLGMQSPVNETAIGNLLTLQNELTLHYPHDKASFDIHWSFTRPGEETPIDEATLWKRAETVTLAGLPCLTLSVEDHLLYLCFHTAIHHCFLYVGPRALLDVARVIANPPRAIDWNTFLARASELDWERGTWLTLELVREYLGISPPAVVLEALKPADTLDSSIREAALETIFLGQQIHESMTPNIVRLFDESSWQKRAAILWNKLWPPREVIASLFQANIDSSSIYLLYARHWQRLFKDHFRKAVSLLNGNHDQESELNRAKLIKHWLES